MPSGSDDSACEIPLPLMHARDAEWPSKCVSCLQPGASHFEPLAFSVEPTLNPEHTETRTWRVPCCRSCSAEFRRRAVWFPRLFTVLAGAGLVLGWFALGDEDPEGVLLFAASAAGALLSLLLRVWLQRASPAPLHLRQDNYNLVFVFRQRAYGLEFERLNEKMWQR